MYRVPKEITRFSHQLHCIDDTCLGIVKLSAKKIAQKLTGRIFQQNYMIILIFKKANKNENTSYLLRLFSGSDISLNDTWRVCGENDVTNDEKR